jgi:heat shock protein HtpX
VVRPGDPQPATSPRDALDRDIARRLRAYPGTLTFHDLIRRNRRESALLVAGMILLGGVLGAVLSAALAAYAGGGGDVLFPAAGVGAAAALALASLGAAWAWFGGSSAILAFAGARLVSHDADPVLHNVVDEMRLAAGLPMPRVYVIDDSALNAFATGRDPAHAAVAVTRGLRDKLTRDELQGVIAHEVAHIRHFDIRFAMLMATMVGLIVFACDAFLRIGRRAMWHAGRGRRSTGGKGGAAAVAIVLLVALLLAILAPIFAIIIQMAYSRRREFLADAGAVELTRNPLGLASALRTLADDEDPFVDGANRGTAHMYIVNPLRRMRRAHNELNTVFSSHPPVRERIARLLALAR